MLFISTPLVLLLVRATIILVAALGAARLLARAAAGTRHLVWLLSLAALLLVPALGTWAPIRVAVLPPARTTADIVRRLEPRLLDGPAPTTRGVPVPPATGTTNSVADGASDTPVPSPIAIAILVWALVALAIAVAMLWAWLAVRRIVRRGEALQTRDWLDPLYEVCDRLDVAEPPRLVRSEDAKMPFACGLLRAVVVLPAECDGWTMDRRRAVLLHEAAHVRRHDLVWHLFARLVCAVYWFHPLVWTAARKLRAESESACDDLALTCGARAADYAEHLLDIVTSVRRDRTPHLAIAMARRSEFEGRMLAILDPERPRGVLRRSQAAFLATGLGLIAILVSAAAPVPRAAHASAVRKVVLEPRAVGSAYPADSARVASQPRVAAPEQVASSSRAAADAEAAAEATADLKAERAVPSAATLVAKAMADTSAGEQRAALLARVLRTDSSAELRRVAAWGLGNLDDQTPVATSALAEAVRRDADASVREMAAWALGDGHESSVATDALSTALRHDADERVRATAAWGLGSLGDRAATDALTAALGDQSDRVRLRAAWALGSVEPRQAPPALIALLGDKDPHIRQVTAWALYSIEDPAAASALQKALTAESDRAVKMAEIRALAAMGEKSVDAVRPLLESPDPEIRTTAIRALAGSGAGAWPWPWPEPRPFAGK